MLLSGPSQLPWAVICGHRTLQAKETETGHWHQLRKSAPGASHGGAGQRSPPRSGRHLYLGLVIQSVVVENHLPLVRGIAPEISLKLLEKR